MSQIPDPEIEPEVFRHLMVVLEQAHEELQLLKLHLFTEQLLNKIIASYLRTDEKAVGDLRLGYDLKVKLVELSHLVPKSGCDVLRKLNGLRQKLAHRLTYTITEDDRDLLRIDLGEAKNISPEENVFRRLAPFLGGYLSGGIRLARMAAERLGESPKTFPVD